MMTHQKEATTFNTTTITAVTSGYILSSYTFAEILIVILFIAILIFGTVGNALIFHFFGIKKKKRKYPQRTVPEYLFCIIAIGDFFSSAFNPLLYSYWTITRYKWYFGYWACKLLVPLGTTATTISAGIFCILSLDRQRIISHPFRRHFKLVNIKISVGVVLAYAMVVNLHYTVNISLKNNKCSVKDVRLQSYSIPTIIYFLIQDFTLIIVIAFSNCRIFSRILYNTATAMIIGDAASKRKKDNIRIVRLLVVLTTVFFVLTLPRDLFQFFHLTSWLFSHNGIRATPATLKLYSFLKVLHVANACINPLIFYRMHHGFKSYIKDCFCIKQPLIETRLSLKSNNSEDRRITLQSRL